MSFDYAVAKGYIRETNTGYRAYDLRTAWVVCVEESEYGHFYARWDRKKPNSLVWTDGGMQDFTVTNYHDCKKMEDEIRKVYSETPDTIKCMNLYELWRTHK